MPALKSTLRFLALGACADMATAFGTIGKVGEYIDVDAENVANTAPACPCDSNAYWYCKISAFPSLGQPRWPSMSLAVMTQSVNFCYNKCYKNAEYLNVEAWTFVEGRGCPACNGPEGFPTGEYGCECKPDAPNYEECNTANDAGDSSADIWYKEICSTFYKPGGQLATNLDLTYQEILPYPNVTDKSGNTEDVPYNPFRHEAMLPGHFAAADDAPTSLCQSRGDVSGDVDPSEACSGVLASGSENVGDFTDCATPVASVASSDQCGKMYYYTDTWVYYCKSGSNYTGIYETFNSFCRGKASEEDCGTIAAPKYYVKNTWGKYNTCAWKNNKCKMHWTGSATPPTVSPAICEASTQDDAGKSAFRVNPSICKQQLCGGGGIAGQDPNDAAC